MSRKAVLWTAVATAVAVLAASLFLASGCRLFAVMSPSMGQAAPVGTLVVSQPADTYVPGDVISFARGERVYTHRVVGVDASGGLVTRGDLNAADDPLPVARPDVIGRAVLLAPGLGWVMMAAPWLVLGALLVYLLSLAGALTRPWRWVVRISGWTLVVALAALWLRPWINLTMLAFVPAQEGGVLMHVVNTGLFPLDAEGTRLASGQDAVVHVTGQDAGGRYTLSPVPALELWQRLVVMLVCLVPFAASFLVRPEPVVGTPSRPPARSRSTPVVVGVLVVAVVAAVAATNQSLSLASYGATVRNSANAAGSRTFFKCVDAVRSLGTSGSYGAWAMGTSRTTSQGETDLSGNGRTARYSTTA
ncbi:MAG: hypothetical protein AAGC63_14625, partial [Propionicimonas sp.]|nr:hypothetical protein [Propionicimonas sp.]